MGNKGTHVVLMHLLGYEPGIIFSEAVESKDGLLKNNIVGTFVAPEDSDWNNNTNYMLKKGLVKYKNEKKDCLVPTDDGTGVYEFASKIAKRLKMNS